MSARIGFPLLIIAFILFLFAVGFVDIGVEPSILGFPVAIGTVCILLALAVLRGEVAHRAHSDPEGGKKRNGFDQSEGLLAMRETWLQLLWLIGFGAMCYLAGFMLGTAIAVTAYFLRDRHGVVVSLAVGIAAAVAVWLLFIQLLGTPMPTEPIFLR